MWRGPTPREGELEEQEYKDGYMVTRITDLGGRTVVGWVEMTTPICTPMVRWLGDQQTCEILEVRIGPWVAHEAAGAVHRWREHLGVDV